MLLDAGAAGDLVDVDHDPDRQLAHLCDGTRLEPLRTHGAAWSMPMCSQVSDTLYISYQVSEIYRYLYACK